MAIYKYSDKQRQETEKYIESYLHTYASQMGGHTEKLSATFSSGMPDRLVIPPHGQMFFVEVKAKGEKPRKIQLVVHERLRKLGQTVVVVDSMQEVEKVINRMFADIHRCESCGWEGGVRELDSVTSGCPECGSLNIIAMDVEDA